MFGFVKRKADSVGDFFRRQWNTKTGRSGILGIIGAGVSVATGTVPITGGVVIAYGALQTMLLRDAEAKKQEERRREETGSG